MGERAGSIPAAAIDIPAREVFLSCELHEGKNFGDRGRTLVRLAGKALG